MSAAIRKRPYAGSATGRVWEIADEMFRQSGGVPSGRAVVDAYLAENPAHNEGTGFTQYSHWKKAHLNHFKRSQRPAADAASGSATGLRLGQGGQLVLPPAVLRELDLSAGERLSLRVVEGELRLVPLRNALGAARALVRRFDSKPGSPVDELLAERRSEAEQ